VAQRRSAAVRPPGTGRAVLAVARRIDLWPVAVRVWFRLVPSGWWRRAPFLPVPSRAYLEFRLLTAYGSEPLRTDRVDLAGDLVAYLEWCRRWSTQ
jgi:hypothetical protein